MLTKLLKFKTASSLGGGQDLLLLEDVDQQGVVVPSGKHVLKDKVARVLVRMHSIISFHFMMKLIYFTLFQFSFFIISNALFWNLVRKPSWNPGWKLTNDDIFWTFDIGRQVWTFFVFFNQFFSFHKALFFLTFEVGRQVWTTLSLGSSMRGVEGQSTLPEYENELTWEHEVIWMIITMTVSEHKNMHNFDDEVDKYDGYSQQQAWPCSIFGVPSK